MPKILLVDDDRNTRILYSRELIDEGYEIVSAAGSGEALEIFRSQRPDIVILDLRMPSPDGLEVLSRMLSIDRRVPIILFSAYSSYRDNFLTWSADDFIEKSSDLSQLKDGICRLLGRGPASSKENTEKLGPTGFVRDEHRLSPMLCPTTP
jgi:DNA-binding response OmpR family regulator